MGNVIRTAHARFRAGLSARSARRIFSVVAAGSLIAATPTRAADARSTVVTEDGYDLWLRYRPVSNTARAAEYRTTFHSLVVPGRSPTLEAARVEIERGLGGLLGQTPVRAGRVAAPGALVVGTPASSPDIASLRLDLTAAGDEGFVIRSTTIGGHRATVIAANRDIGALYGAFHLLRHLQLYRPLANLPTASTPKIKLRMLDHWDNLDRSVERGYAGRSLWEWSRLPDTLSERYRDYARANASLGINGAAITNVNADARVLTPEYLKKVAALAGVFRPYGVKLFLTARFSAPIEIGGLKTADPADGAVRAWWKAKATEIYELIPDFGGFVVKANSEGQPGPQDYKRSHAEGANILADAVAPYGGIVSWRAFVYSAETPSDRIRQAYDEFKTLDGLFRDNVFVQVKNGPLDFQPREPFSALFGAMPKTPVMMEFQITKEYLGQDTHLAYMGTYFKEILNADTYATGKGSTVAKVIDGSVHKLPRSGIAGVANVGDDRNWTGSQFNQANWYAYGRLAWDHTLSDGAIADEWIRMTFTNDAAAVAKIRAMMITSREAVVNYMTPLGLVHIMATGHHYGPGAWVSNAGRPDWSPTYYHRADTIGIGFNRTATGSNAVGQYFPPVRDRYSSRATTPDSVLLWFHRVKWDDKLKNGRTVWDEMVRRYYAGVDSVRSMRRTWDSVKGSIDAERFAEVADFLRIQEKEAIWWRDASLLYFQTHSRRPIPARFEKPAHDLAFYLALRCPPDRNKPRCQAIY